MIYGEDARYGTRLAHVFELLTPNAAKKIHSVFSVGTKADLIRLLDEAWARKGAEVLSNAGVYDINMGKTIGTRGETTIRIVVKPGTSDVVTAFPIL